MLEEARANSGLRCLSSLEDNQNEKMMQRSLEFDLMFCIVVAAFTDHYYNINRKNNINMGGNGEDTPIDTARRVCFPESRQEYIRIHQIRGGPRGQIQASASVGETRRAAPEPGGLPKRLKGNCHIGFLFVHDAILILFREKHVEFHFYFLRSKLQR